MMLFKQCFQTFLNNVFSNIIITCIVIVPEQFTVKAHPALFEGEGRGKEKLRNTFQRLRPEEFLSRDFGLRSFRQPEILAWAEISNLQNLESPKSRISEISNQSKFGSFLIMRSD